MPPSLAQAFLLRPLADGDLFAGAAFLAAVFLAAVFLAGAFFAAPLLARGFALALGSTAFFARACLTWIRSTLRVGAWSWAHATAVSKETGC